MAQCLFVKSRNSVEPAQISQKLEQVCSLLTPEAILEKSQNIVKVWPDDQNSFYAIQNSENAAEPEKDTLVIGWIQPSDESEIYSSEADGSYAVIKNNEDEVSFFTDQFGSRALWYYFDKDLLIVSTSQRAIVAFNGNFKLNEEALAWYLSSGCQGPFISWDKDIKQVLPNLEYKLEVNDWSLDSRQKLGMDLPVSGSVKMNDYLDLYQSEVTESLNKIINKYPKGQVLMPLSGGLDSRSLLALTHKAGLDDKVTLVNWGSPKQDGVFDDKAAAKRIATFYGKDLLDMSLPADIKSYDQVFDRYAEECEGRIEHINAFTDGFKVWEDLFLQGYRVVVRGDIPVTEGLDQNDIQMRERIGLTLFEDYANIKEFPVRKYIKLQNDFGSKRLKGESLIRWRDRLFATYTMPIQVSAFSHQISGFAENRAPMLNWSLFRQYIGLADKEKGSKLHMQKLWERNDETGVSRYATGSLDELSELFKCKRGNQYLLEKLAAYEERELFSSELIMAVQDKLNEQTYSTNKSLPKRVLSKAKPILTVAYSQLNDNIPLLLKSYIRSKRTKNLSASTIGYRMVLAEKIITMYESDANSIEENV